MNHHHHAHAAFHAKRAADPVAVPDPSPVVIVVDTAPEPVRLEQRSHLLPRQKCRPDDTSPRCEKPQKPNNAVYAAVAVIPIIIAIIVFFFLHRRHKKRLALEDINDKHKSLDFGMGEAGMKAKGKKGKKGPEMADVRPADLRKGRGMSMDMDMDSPYMLPAALQGSRESFHSLSRSIKDSNDPYRQVPYASGGDPYRSRLRNENSSIYSGSSNATDRANLLKNAQRNPSSLPPRGTSLKSESLRSEPISLGSPHPPMPPHIQLPETAHSPDTEFTRKPVPQPSNALGLAPGAGLDTRDSYFDNKAKEMRSSTNYLGNFIHSRDASAEVKQPSGSLTKRLPTPPQPPSQTSSPIQPLGPVQSSPLPRPPVPPVIVEPTVPKRPSPPPVTGLPARPGVGLPTSPAAGLPTTPRPPRLQSAHSPVHIPNATVQPGNTASYASETSDYGDSFRVTPPSPPRIQVYEETQRRLSFDGPMPVMQQPQPQGLGVQGLGQENKRLSMSIRPLPAEDPTDNPEQRANRIRSFYKEYFDDRKADPMPAAPANYVDYYEDYGQEYTDGAIFDPSTGNFVFAHAQAPYAEPVTRRAMTPPPRAPPRFRGPPGRGHGYSGSSGFLSPAGHRSGSPMSARSAPVRKNLPPPQPLKSVPTPHMLKDDAAIFSAADFAPPPTYRERQNGRRPDSPMGVARPYSPSVSPHVPLASAFNELSAVPSPFQLRKSGTFTALDFAPPPRFRNGDGGSDTASIRSNRSGISAMGLQSVRAGAYRVSRIPKEFVDTRDNMASVLKPRLNMVNPA